MAITYEICVDWDVRLMVESRRDSAIIEGYIHCSSISLKAASPVFNTMLTGCWREGRALVKTGFVEIRTLNFGIHALLILFKIIHGDNTVDLINEADAVTLEELYNVGDYYDCMDVIEAFATVSKEQFISMSMQMQMSFLWISWRFQFPRPYELLSGFIINNCESQFVPRGLLFDDDIIGMAPDISISGRTNTDTVE